MSLSTADQISKLEAARQLVLADSTHYAQIVPGILPIIGAHADLDIRRWGTEFLAETFATPILENKAKESLSIVVLQTLKDLLEVPGEDAGVIQSVIRAAASIYGFVLRYTINNPNDSTAWSRMAAIKSNIMKRWDTATTGIRICCIKFAQRVVQVQTPGLVADPRRPEQNEISLALVPRDHPLIPQSNLEAEASGLLDRLLNIFYEESRQVGNRGGQVVCALTMNCSDAVLVNATLNCMSVLVRTRQSISNKIIAVVLNFNPMKQASSTMSPKFKVQIRSMERTTRAFLMNIQRRNENGPFSGRIKQHVERMDRTRIEVFDEGSRKRAAPSEPTDGLDNAKRMRLGAEITGRASPPPLPAGPVSVAQLFTLTSEQGLTSFDVTQLPIELTVRIALPVLQRIDHGLLDEAINSVRSRYLYLSRKQQAAVQIPPPPPPEEDEDYEPDFEPMEDSEQILNKVDTLPLEDGQDLPAEIAIRPFELAQPPPLTEEEAGHLGRGTISRVFSMMNVLEEPNTAKRHKSGLNRLAGSNYDREAWTTVITRLASRASAGLEAENDEKRTTVDRTNGTIAIRSPNTLSDGIRETLWKYIIEDFRIRIPIAIAWLNEEWYNDRMQIQAAQSDSEQDFTPHQHCEKWVLKVLDGIVPYLDAKDKVLIRFLSEIPGINEQVLERVKGLARDPERVGLAVNAIHYLILLRPPVREICIDALEDLWRNYEDARLPTAKLLSKWRPGVLEDRTSKLTLQGSPTLVPKGESVAAG